MNVLVVGKNNLGFEVLKRCLNEYRTTYEYADEDYDAYNLNDYKYIIFFHHSKKIPAKIYKNYKCIIVHTSNLPHGRGGSPIQNQIKDGIVNSRVNLIEAADELDSGRVYISKDITLQGAINDIFRAIAITTAELIDFVVTSDIQPEVQQGQPTAFKRITNNELDFDASLEEIYDQIRMVDGCDYPKATLKIGRYTLEFSRSQYDGKKILCDVVIQ